MPGFYKVVGMIQCNNPMLGIESDTQSLGNNVTVNAVTNDDDDEYDNRRKSIMTRRVGRGSFSSPGGTMGTGPLFLWRLWLWPSIALPRTGAQPVTYCCQRAHEDAHRRQLRGHALHAAHLAHTLPLHVAAAHDHWGQARGKVRVEGKGSPAAWSSQHGPAGWYVSFLARVYSCGERDARSSVHAPGCP